MKFTFVVYLLIASCSMTAFAQIKYPEPSYESTIMETVGFTHLTIRYGRPLQRGRMIFGGLVPYDQRWRTGAGRTTLISFDTPVTIGNKTVTAGTYALLTVPGSRSWHVILHRDTTMFTQRRDYAANDEVANVEVTPTTLSEHVEAFTIATDIVNHNALVTLKWDFVSVKFEIVTAVLNDVMGKINTSAKRGDLKTAEQLRGASEFIALNLPYLKPSAKDSAIMLIDKALLLPDENKDWTYQAKRNIFLFSKDWPNYEKTVREAIEFIRRRNDAEAADDIRWWETEMAKHKTMIHEKRSH
jgi:hypothetical protein